MYILYNDAAIWSSDVVVKYTEHSYNKHSCEYRASIMRAIADSFRHLHMYGYRTHNTQVAFMQRHKSQTQ